MRFLGPVTQLGDELVRPHDLELHRTDPGRSRHGRVERVTRVGFEVRMDLEVDGQHVLASLTRPQAAELDLEPGDTLWVRPTTGAPTVSAGQPTANPASDALVLTA